MNKYLEKIAAEIAASKPLAVIVKGNPKYLNDPSVKRMADHFYLDLAGKLEDKGYKVEFDPGKPHTLPNTNAAVWVGHSRGLDRLDFAPPHIKTIYLETNDTHSDHGNADFTGRDPAHYQLSDKDLYKLDKLGSPTKPEDLGIDLSKGDEKELNKWLIAVTLFSKPIQREVAAIASRRLTSEGISTADDVQRTGYDGIVKALVKGHYSHYDFSTADTLLAQAEHLKSKYGTLKNLVDNHGPERIKEEILSFKGIGPKGSELFMEGLSPHLDKYRGPAQDILLVPVNEDSKRLREILVNSSRKGLFNPYSVDQYNWSKFKEERNAEGKLVKYHVWDKTNKKYAELHHPEIHKYKLRDQYE